MLDTGLKSSDNQSVLMHARYLLPLILILLTACASEPATRESVGAPPAITAAAPTATSVQPPETDQLPAGRNDDGTYYLGEADAPLTLIDYSDFL